MLSAGRRVQRRVVCSNVLHLRNLSCTPKPPSLLLNDGLLSIRRYHGNGLTARRIAFPVRDFSIFTIPKLAAKFVRVPMTAAASAVVGGVTYINYKVNEASSYTTDKLNQVTGWMSETYDGLKDRFEGFEMPGFSMRGGAGAQNKTKDEKDEEEPNGKGPEVPVVAAAVVAAALNKDLDSEDKMMVLTKQMIEIRQILQRIDQSDTLQLPSIVVIGSQSSGKSSVLEAIVGHEFLPKGNNMVTRRPIELTLVNTPDSAAEYAEFPALKMGHITDFTQVQKTLTDLNMSVPDHLAVSDDPIQLNIYSPKVPDLTLIDLPGYIQVAASDQPGSLKQKINALCEKYIQAPNVILAISAADVDLANSSALRASRRVDPRGERTIGVITKMDLVPPSRGVETLTNQSYPLKMGYVGVITRTPQTVGLFRRSSTISDLIMQNEDHFFGQHEEYEDCTVGTRELQNKLMNVLESTMSASLGPTTEAIRQELEEASYQFKVEFNDRSLTPQTYLASSIDSFKLAFKDLSSHFGREQVRRLLKNELDQRVLDILAQRYWNKPNTPTSSLLEPALSELPKSAVDDLFWHRKLDASTSSLTKLGVGRLSTTLVINALTNQMNHLISQTSFHSHPFAVNAIQEATSEILNMRYYSTADQVENCIKPYKYEVEVEEREWTSSRDHAYNLLKEELRQCDDSFNNLRKSIGSKKLNQVMTFIEKAREVGHAAAVSESEEAFGFSQALLAKGREALFLRDRSEILKMRMAAVNSRQCKNKANKYYCPEVFLDVVANKLTQTAVLFLNVELLSDFYYNFPRELDSRLGTNLTEEQIENFAKQDPKIKSHIELQRRKDLLELALSKIESVTELHKKSIRPRL